MNHIKNQIIIKNQIYEQHLTLSIKINQQLFLKQLQIFSQQQEMSRCNTQNEQQVDCRRRVLNRKLKTISSMGGTFTQQSANNFDHSIISKRDIFLNNPFSSSEDKQKDQQMSVSQVSKVSRPETELGKISRIQSEVNDISKMKMMFESRINSQKQHNINHNKSIDKSPNTKSIQKHILKPSNTPNFNKFQNKKLTGSIISKDMDACFNVKIDCQLSQLSRNPHVEVEKKQAFYPSSQKKTRFECSQISSKFVDYDFGSEFKQSSFDFSQQNKEFYRNSFKNKGNDQTPQKIDFSSSRNNNHQQIIQTRSQVKPDSRCNCEGLLKDFIEQTGNKMAQITERLMLLENENARLRKLQDKVIQNAKHLELYKNQAESMEKQCNQLKESNYSQQAEKEELESLLKELLFKREKEKYQKTPQYSKQNTQRSQFDPQISVQSEKSQNRNPLSHLRNQQDQEQDFAPQLFYNNNNTEGSFKRDSSNCSKRDIQPLGSRVTNIPSHERSIKNEQKQQKQTDSKMKVQNLLSKIQIKIQKS